jgi:dTDP-glucose 4,6-dehydratase
MIDGCIGSLFFTPEYIWRHKLAHRILVTGGLGTIGSKLIQVLRGRGHQVWILDLPHHHDPQYFRCDVGSFRQLERVFSQQQFDYVYHLAAEFGRWNGEDFYDTLWLSNAIGTKNIIRWQERQGFRLIFSSSSEVYGDYEGVMAEDVMESVEIRQLNDYAISKWVSEMQIMNSAAMHNTETVRIRYFNTYGPGEYYSSYRSVNCLFCYRALHGIPFTVYQGHHRTSTFIDDAVEATANIADNFIPGEVYNIASGEYHDIETLAQFVLEATNADPSLATYKEAEPFTTKNKRVDNSKAVRDLGMTASVSLQEGVQRTIDWMRQVYQIG